MLATVERALKALRVARTDADFERIIGDTAQRFGFRSAYILQYATELRSAERVIDTDPRRRAWWPSYFNSDLRREVHQALKTIGSAPILRLDALQFASGSQTMRRTLSEYDLIEATMIPISYDGALVGASGFPGNPTLNATDEMALQLISYAVFAQIRTMEPPAIQGVALTPREREVIALSADGLTSQQIAARLGMSPRTANQHIDNVAEKLGTRNRAHTVAEVIRNSLLN
jgi:DNA-binding CsgD family transcriptional regulator